MLVAAAEADVSTPIFRIDRRHLAIIGAALLFAGCSPARQEAWYEEPEPEYVDAARVRAERERARRQRRERRAAMEAGSDAPDSGPIRRITSFEARVPAPWELPAVRGNLQRHEVAVGEDLLDIARRAGVGFRELRDGNPTVDEWRPTAGSELIIPTRWILPNGNYRGIVVNVPEFRLYMYPQDTYAGERVPVTTYAVGIGVEEAPSPVTSFKIKSKDENPTWYVPDSIFKKMENPRRIVPPGPDNPLGDYRIRLDFDLYALHGTNDPWSVGRMTTHGCIRLYPEDIEALYPQVSPGMRGAIVYQPVKLGERNGQVYLEVHRDVYQMYDDLSGLTNHAMAEIAKANLTGRVDLDRVRAAVKHQTGIPVNVSRQS
jgi:L,D-transpeptidase ErfK/SrfK